MPGCTTVLEGDDVLDVLKKMREHIRIDHQMPALWPGMTVLIQRAIKET
jgi:hypothetical protein